MQINKKIMKKYPITTPYDWLVEYYSFNLSLALKPITPIPDTHAIRMAITLLLCMA